MSGKSARRARQQAAAHTSRKERAGQGARATKPPRRPVSRTPVWVAPAAVVAALALLVGAFLIYRWYTAPLPPKTPSSSATDAVVSAITSLPASEFDAIGQGGATEAIKPISGTPLTGGTGKPEVLYIGAEYCPYCAAERWALIVALARFGTFSGLQTTTSSSTDIYPNTPTWTFRNASFTSLYIDFRAVETTDREQRPLQTPSAAEQTVWSKYDSSESIPFVDFGNVYMFSGATYSPDTLSGMTWQQIATALQNQDSTQAKAIVGSANLITAAICKMTSGKPAEVCSSTTIQALESKLG
jgi:Domain of unknown function (DUF929)